MKTICMLAAITTAGVMLASAGTVGAQHHVTRADVNGEWNATLSLEQGSHDLSLVFAITDSAFAGQVYDGGRLFGPMEHGTLSGDTVRFAVEQLGFTGVITGARMNVALVVYNGTTRTFVAVKRPDAKKGL
jgi:hypothetical protein